MNSKQAKALRRMMTALGVTKDKPELRLHYKTIDTGRKYIDPVDGPQPIYRQELCNPYKRAFKELVKALKSNLRR